MFSIGNLMRNGSTRFPKRGLARQLGSNWRAPRYSAGNRRTRFAELGAIGASIAATYLLDPELGRQRRAVLRDKLGKGLRQAEDFAGKAGRDLRNRTQGALAETRAMVTQRSPRQDWSGSQPGTGLDIMKSNWAPATRALASLGGMALAAFGARRASLPGAALAASGAAMLIRALTNRELKDVAKHPIGISPTNTPTV